MLLLYLLALGFFQALLCPSSAASIHSESRSPLSKRDLKVGLAPLRRQTSSPPPAARVYKNDCSKWQRKEIKAQVEEARGMLFTSYMRLRALAVSMRPGGVWEERGFPRLQDWPRERFVTYKLFRNLIEPSLPLTWDPDDFIKDTKNNPKGAKKAMSLLEQVIQTQQYRAGNILDNIKSLTSVWPMDDRANVQITCDVSWLEDVRHTPETETPNSYTGTDNRPMDSVKPEYLDDRKNVTLPNGLLPKNRALTSIKAGHENAPDAYVFGDMAGPFNSIIALNMGRREEWYPEAYGLPSYKTILTQDPSLHPYKLKDLAKHYFSARLIELFARLPALAGSSAPVIQQPCDSRSEDSWTCAIDLAKNGPRKGSNGGIGSTESSVNFMYLVIGLALKSQPWNLGPDWPTSPRPLGPWNDKPPQKAILPGTGDSKQQTHEGGDGVDRKGFAQIPNPANVPAYVPPKAPVKYANAEAALHAMFPNGYDVIETSGENLLCGLRAIINTMQAMYPYLPQPTVDQLMQIFNSPQFQAEQAIFGLTNQNEFHIDQLGAVLQLWGQSHNIPLRVGGILENDVFLVPYQGEETPFIVWVHNALFRKKIQEEEEERHYSGVKPITVQEGSMPAGSMHEGQDVTMTDADPAEEQQDVTMTDDNPVEEKPKNAMSGDLKASGGKRKKPGGRTLSDDFTPRKSARLAGIPPPPDFAKGLPH